MRRERGNKSKKAYLENEFSDQSNLSRKPSGRGADWKVRITSYESQVKSHKDRQIKAASAPLSLCFMGVNAEKCSGWLSHTPRQEESLRKGHCDNVDTHPS